MENQVVIITGAARGIGFGIAECFAAKHAKIVIADTNEAGAKDAAACLEKAGASATLGLGCDITKLDEVEAMTARVLSAFGRIDVLVNNAGICPFVPIMEITPEVFQRTLDVNLIGAVHCTRVVARHMIERHKQGNGGGRIVFITSMSENFVSPSQVDYGASKSGLRMAMKGFAGALGAYGITCNAVAPGIILTDMGRAHWEKEERAQYIKGRVPVGRIGHPRDVGHACVFLASAEAEYISGISLHVDGGYQTQNP